MIMDLTDLIISRVAVQPKGKRNACVDHQNVMVLLVKDAQGQRGTDSAFMAKKVSRSLSCF